MCNFVGTRRTPQNIGFVNSSLSASATKVASNSASASFAGTKTHPKSPLKQKRVDDPATQSSAKKPRLDSFSPTAQSVSSKPRIYTNTQYEKLRQLWKQQLSRPDFDAASKRAAIETVNIRDGLNIPKCLDLNSINAARPHRVSFEMLRDRLIDYLIEEDDLSDFTRWTDRLLSAQAEKLSLLEEMKKTLKADVNLLSDSSAVEKSQEQLDRVRFLIGHIEGNTKTIRGFREALIDGDHTLMQGRKLVDTGDPSKFATQKLALLSFAEKFLSGINGLYSNINDLGPHRGVNIRVQGHLHLHFGSDGSMTPASLAAVNMTPDGRHKVAVTEDNLGIVCTDGAVFPILNLDADLRVVVEAHGTKPISKYVPVDNYYGSMKI